jgi:hypothetical protein
MALGELWLGLLFDDPVVSGSRGDVICSPAGLWLALAALEARVEGETREELRGVVGSGRAEDTEDAVIRQLGQHGAFIASARMSSRSPGQPCLVSTVALEAKWEQPFEPSFTRELPFTDAEGVTRHVPTMVAEVPVEDAWTLALPHGRVTVVELRASAGDGGAAPPAQPVRVRFALGEDRRVPPVEVISASWAPAAQGKPIRGSRGSRHPEAVLLELPRHRLSGDIEVSPQLAAQRAVQRCLVRFDEEGMTSEISAATAEDRRWAGRDHFDGPGQLLRTAPVRLDRPFAVSVLDGSGTIPLLAGYQAGWPGAR